MAVRNVDIQKTFPKMVALPSVINSRQDIDHVPDFQDLLSRVFLDVTVEIIDPLDGKPKPILAYLSPKLKTLRTRIKKTEDKNGTIVYLESLRDRLSVAAILKARQTSDQDFKRLSLNDKLAPLYASALLIAGFNRAKALKVLPYLTFKREYEVEVIKTFTNAIGVYRVECNAKNPIADPYQIPLDSSYRIALRLENRDLRYQNAKQSTVKNIHDAFSHVLSKENHLNRFSFSKLGLEVSFSDNLKGFDKQRNITAIYCKSIRLDSSIGSQWQLVGYLKRLQGDRVGIELNPNINAIQGFNMLPNALKSLGLFATDCLRYRVPQSNLATRELVNNGSVNCLAEFWLQFNMHCIGDIRDNGAIRLQYRKPKK